MSVLLPILAIVLAYLIGSTPFGYLAARMRGVNILESGSGRIGATNALRAAGLGAATITVLGDAFKGLIPTFVATYLFDPWVAALVGVATVLGHNYSIFLKFKGGVGAVTALGALVALSLPAALTAAAVAIIAIVISRYASMGSFLGNVTGLVMLVVLAVVGWTPPGYILYGILVVAIISWALRPNFARIRAGTERKIGNSEERIKPI